MLILKIPTNLLQSTPSLFLVVYFNVFAILLLEKKIIIKKRLTRYADFTDLGMRCLIWYIQNLRMNKQQKWE